MLGAPTTVRQLVLVVRRIRLLTAALLTIVLLATACEAEGKPDSERLADEVGAERCVAPLGGTGGIYTCDFRGARKRCYEVGFAQDDSATRDEGEFLVVLRHQGACTREDKPSLPG